MRAPANMRVLIVQDSASQAAAVADVLATAEPPLIEVRQVATLAGAAAALAAERLEVVMLDLDAVGLEGLERLIDLAPEAAVIALSTRKDTELAVRALAAGAQDYLITGPVAPGESIRRSLLLAHVHNLAEQVSRRLASIVDDSAEAIVGVANDGTITSWNAAAERMYAYRAEAAIGREISMLACSEAQRLEIRRQLAVVARGQRIVDFETTRLRGDGREIDVSLTISPICGSGGRVVGTVSVGRDVSERKRAQRARERAQAELLEQRELLSSVFDNAPIGLAIVSPGGAFLRVNHALCAITGYSEAALLGLNFQQITHPDDLLDSIEGMQQTLTIGNPALRTEKRYLHRAGHVIWINLSITAMYDQQGTLLRYVSQYEDISARKQAELAVLRERDHSAAIIAAMGEGCALVVDRRITAANEALSELTGFAREQLLEAEPPWPFWPPESAQPLASLWSEVEAGGGDKFEVVLMHRNGTRFEAEVTARPARGPDGGALGWVNTIRDVSERRRYEAELERLAMHDSLTGLPNHRLFHQRLEEEVANAVRHGRPLSIAVIDVDRFKAVNDMYGHLTGDRTLEEVARRVAAVVRHGEMLARVGGEEFAWILPESDGDGAVLAAERARQAVAAESFEPVGKITISIGVAELDASHDRARLYQRADASLYEAKRAGRDRTVRFGA